MMTKYLFTEVADEPMNFHALIIKVLMKEYYEYTAEYLFGDCRCTLEDAERMITDETYHNDDLFKADDNFAKKQVINNIEDVAKAVCGRKPGKSLEQMLVDHDWQPLYQLTISYYLPEEIKHFVSSVSKLVSYYQYGN